MVLVSIENLEAAAGDEWGDVATTEAHVGVRREQAVVNEVRPVGIRVRRVGRKVVGEDRIVGRERSGQDLIHPHTRPGEALAEPANEARGVMPTRLLKQAGLL